MVRLQLVEGADPDMASLEVERRIARIRSRLPADALDPSVAKARPGRVADHQRRAHWGRARRPVRRGSQPDRSVARVGSRGRSRQRVWRASTRVAGAGQLRHPCRLRSIGSAGFDGAGRGQRHLNHCVALIEILEVHQGAPRCFLNAGTDRRAALIMVGPMAGGRLLCVPVEPTGRFAIWRPVTAFEANTHRRTRYQGSNQ
ncbi:MAG: AcrB/AcrD/AcrF family [Chloroflexi bacterium]|nr:AcrB/AcrD/AcrF family [Chloroflexota bacterium]